MKNPAGPQSNQLRKLWIDHVDLSESQNFHQKPMCGVLVYKFIFKTGNFLIK